jgi:hypothetical protein
MVKPSETELFHSQDLDESLPLVHVQGQFNRVFSPAQILRVFPPIRQHKANEVVLEVFWAICAV